MDAPVSHKASTIVLFTLTLYRMALSELTSSTVTSLITLPSHSESELVSLSCMPPMSCLVCSTEEVDSLGWLERAASLTEMLLFLAFLNNRFLYF